MDSKTQHTSWTVDECPDERGFSVIRPHDGTPNGNTDEHPIATVYAPEHARLIAAAPEMYEALKGLLACPALNTEGLEPFDVEAVDAATAAIARAEGR